MSGVVWEYRPRSHKTEHRDRSRVVLIGPRAQEIIRPWLRENPDEFIFGPRQNREAQLRDQPEPRPRTEWEKRNRKRRILRDRYTLDAYESVIRKGCVKAGVDRWGPNRLRHCTATVVRSKYGIEAVRTILGHNDVATSLIYAERDLDTARRIMGEVG